MRVLPSLLTVALLSPVVVHADPGSPFKHDWRFENDGTRLVSNHRAPAPFSRSGEPEATLVVEVERPSREKPASLDAIVRNEIQGIRDDLKLAEYLEEDGHKPDRDVASWNEDVAGEKVAFIKYRVAGKGDKLFPVPRTVIHAIAVKGGYTLFFHLTVLYAEHQEEIRADQRRMIELMLPKFPPKQ